MRIQNKLSKDNNLRSLKKNRSSRKFGKLRSAFVIKPKNGIKKRSDINSQNAVRRDIEKSQNKLSFCLRDNSFHNVSDQVEEILTSPFHK